MLSIDQLRLRIAPHFPAVLQVADTVLRFVRSANERSYAICYVDVGVNLPRTQEELTSYQDRVIGRHYFEGEKSLQWSNYLYFVTSPEQLRVSEVRHAKELIEADRSYARKFVIGEDQLEDVLFPVVVASRGLDQAPNILSVWTQRLMLAGMDQAILPDIDIPKRIRLLESPGNGGESRPLRKSAKPLKSLRSPPFLSSLRLNRYRRYPTKRSFEFGKVNLIFGPNAAGKTSLLEAIELYFCGRNRRSPDQREHYDLVVIFADGRTDKATSSRKPQLFRERNLAWYGRHEARTNTLFQSFAQYNFLDTDAAANLAASAADIESDLSKLLVGPDASRVWRNIQRTSEALAGTVRERQSLLRSINAERKTLQEWLKDIATIKQESEAVGLRLNEMLARHRWASIDVSNRELSVTSLLSALSELSATANQISAQTWVIAPSTRASLKAYISAAKRELRLVVPMLVQFEKKLGEQRRLNSLLVRNREAYEVSLQLMRYVEAEVPQRFERRLKAQNNFDRLVGLASDAELFDFEESWHADTASLLSRIKQSTTRVAAAKAALARTNREYDRFSRLRDQAANLSQQMRQLAAEIISKSVNRDECPLCHTQFAPGTLASHMTSGVDPHLNLAGQGFLSRIKEQSSALELAESDSAHYAILKKFADRAGLASNVSVANALLSLRGVRKDLDEVRKQLSSLNAEVKALGKSGLTNDGFLEHKRRLTGLGFQAGSTAEAIAVLTADIAKRLKAESATLDKISNEIKIVGGELNRRLSTNTMDITHYHRLVAHTRERIEQAKTLRARFDDLAKEFSWPNKAPFAELVTVIVSIQSVATELQQALRRERLNEAKQPEAAKRKASLDQQSADLTAKLERLISANSILRELLEEFSLESAMRSAIEGNRESIELIFRHIHSPAEFVGLGKKLDSLRRQGEPREAQLSEISTGQRAALALSIFLAQNAQLSVAPPIMLIDDPIAHVDDLNSLSFLDYLREVATRDARQIFFATANDKIASLFERKFDFLGAKEFRRIELARE